MFDYRCIPKVMFWNYSSLDSFCFSCRVMRKSIADLWYMSMLKGWLLMMNMSWWDLPTLTRDPWMVQGILRLLWVLISQHTRGQERRLIPAARLLWHVKLFYFKPYAFLFWNSSLWTTILDPGIWLSDVPLGRAPWLPWGIFPPTRDSRMHETREQHRQKELGHIHRCRKQGDEGTLDAVPDSGEQRRKTDRNA